jgi:membrane-associated phospholipid phosphatase
MRRAKPLSWISFCGVTLALTLLGGPARAQTTHPKKGWWWTPSDDILQYSANFLVLGLLPVFASIKPTSHALIGPSFDPNHPSEILSPEHAADLGHRYAVSETVPTWELMLLAGGANLVVIGEAMAHARANESLDPDAPSAYPGAYIHDTFFGAADAVLFTFTSTEVLKTAFGRLRPDFQDRVKLAYCALPFPVIDCTGVKLAPTPPDVFVDGRSSFPSGHASISFATATYGFLVLGGQFQWGEQRSAGLGLLAAVGQAAMLGTATWVAATRIADGRHNPTDVIAGGLLGTAWAHFAYWRRFDVRGRPRRLNKRVPYESDPPVSLVPMPGGLGLAGRF